MSITTAFLTFVAVVVLADIQGPGHDWVPLGAAVAWFFLCRSLRPRDWRWLLTGSLALSVAIAALAVVQMGFMDRARGPFASPNYLGAYAVLMFFLAVAGRSLAGQWLGTIPAAANLISLGLSQSRGALLALGAGLLVMWGRRRPLVALACATVVMAAILLIRPGTTNPRADIWWIGLQAAQQRLLLGWGQGGLGMPGLGGFYNIPLDWLVAAGILGVLAGAWLLIVTAKVALKEGQPHLLAFLAAWFVQGLFLFSIPATSIPLIAVLAYLSVRRGRGRQDVEDVAGLVDGHEILRPGRRGLERLRAEKLRFAKLRDREADPVQKASVDLGDEAREVDRAGDRRGCRHAEGHRPNECASKK